MSSLLLRGMPPPWSLISIISSLFFWYEWIATVPSSGDASTAFVNRLRSACFKEWVKFLHLFIMFQLSKDEFEGLSCQHGASSQWEEPVTNLCLHGTGVALAYRAGFAEIR